MPWGQKSQMTWPTAPEGERWASRQKEHSGLSLLTFPRTYSPQGPTRASPALKTRAVRRAWGQEPQLRLARSPQFSIAPEPEIKGQKQSSRKAGKPLASWLSLALSMTWFSQDKRWQSVWLVSAVNIEDHILVLSVFPEPQTASVSPLIVCVPIHSTVLAHGQHSKQACWVNEGSWEDTPSRYKQAIGEQRGC